MEVGAVALVAHRNVSILTCRRLHKPSGGGWTVVFRFDLSLDRTVC